MLSLIVSLRFLPISKVWAVRGSQSFFKNSLEKACTSHKCPLCSRGYDSETEFQLLLTSVRWPGSIAKAMLLHGKSLWYALLQIERRLNSKVPELTVQYETKLDKAKDVHQHLQELKPIISEVDAMPCPTFHLNLY